MQADSFERRPCVSGICKNQVLTCHLGRPAWRDHNQIRYSSVCVVEYNMRTYKAFFLAFSVTAPLLFAVWPPISVVDAAGRDNSCSGGSSSSSASSSETESSTVSIASSKSFIPCVFPASCSFCFLLNLRKLDLDRLPGCSCNGEL